MFKCAKCGNVHHGAKEFRITTHARKVIYLNQVKYEKLVRDGKTSKSVVTYKTLSQTIGTEIVKQESYCKNHIPENLEVLIVGEAKRKTIISIKNEHRGEN